MKGVALISVLIVASLLAFLGIGFVFIMVAESKISQTQITASQAHYLAEAGAQKAIWQLNNDAEWKKDFEDGDLFEELKLTNELYPGDEIKIEVKSLSPGKAEIESSATYKKAKRKVMVKVFKALGEPEELETLGLFTNYETSAVFSDAEIKSGSLQANTDLNLMVFSEFNVEGTASANKINVDLTSELLAQEIIEGAPPILMPALDFDNYKQKADLVYSVEDFASLLAANPVLNGIIYVTGSEYCLIDIERKQTLTINGFLLTDCAVHLADKGEFGYTKLIINNSPGQPSGLASKGSLVIQPLTSQFNVSGLIYTLKDVAINGPISDFDINGGLISKSLMIINQLNKLNITYNEAVIKQTLGDSYDSPMIIMEHWEEEY